MPRRPRPWQARLVGWKAELGPAATQLRLPTPRDLPKSAAREPDLVPKRRPAALATTLRDCLRSPAAKPPKRRRPQDSALNGTAEPTPVRGVSGARQRTRSRDNRRTRRRRPPEPVPKRGYSTQKHRGSRQPRPTSEPNMTFPSIRVAPTWTRSAARRAARRTFRSLVAREPMMPPRPQSWQARLVR